MIDRIEKPNRSINRVFIHCSASPTLRYGDDLYDFIERIHVKQNGWSTIGYHFLIDRAGGLIPARSLEMIPAAQKGHNTSSIAICLDGLHKADFTARQYQTLLELCNKFNTWWGDSVTYHGHCEVANKLCPVFDYKTVLNLTKDGRINNGENND